MDDRAGEFWFSDGKDHWDQISGVNAYGQVIVHLIPSEHGHVLGAECPCEPDLDIEELIYTHKRAH